MSNRTTSCLRLFGHPFLSGKAFGACFAQLAVQHAKGAGAPAAGSNLSAERGSFGTLDR